jgi:hypothetical protein
MFVASILHGESKLANDDNQTGAGTHKADQVGPVLLEISLAVISH